MSAIPIEAIIHRNMNIAMKGIRQVDLISASIGFEAK